MRHFLVILCASGALCTSAVAQEQQYGWAISLSDTDPFANSGAEVGTPISAYLWLVCAEPGGMTVAVFDLAFTQGSGTVHSFTGRNGILNAGTPTHLLLVTGGCYGGSFVAGQIQLEFAPYVGQCDLCIVPDMEGINVTVDCEILIPHYWPNHTVGLTTSSGPPPCDDRIDGMLCYAPVSVGDTSWGKVKSLYR